MKLLCLGGCKGNLRAAGCALATVCTMAASPSAMNRPTLAPVGCQFCLDDLLSILEAEPL